ncbi:hypothetical protein [Novosphingobium sp. CECT 9465]|uniref:DUF7662 domain-containing protein n=1 Tax=Novosphingobium sp. CECT 9465 TaxID=2829794 RepID=UPI001E2CE539|nr:hypothetical protein [Novosphingobium sp. CECT 9465]CAH0497781.1 hypothetical protein NVSP9465_02851 [Novosphingobium sp. CECT 9465]
MSKYDTLIHYLASLTSDSTTLKFAEVSALVPGGLPQSAYDHRPWWANRHDGKDAQNKGWQSAGWETADVDMVRQIVTFHRVGKRTGPPVLASNQGVLRPLSIAEAKEGLALKFGVSPDQIDINIRG